MLLLLSVLGVASGVGPSLPFSPSAVVPALGDGFQPGESQPATRTTRAPLQLARATILSRQLPEAFCSPGLTGSIDVCYATDAVAGPYSTILSRYRPLATGLTNLTALKPGQGSPQKM